MAGKKVLSGGGCGSQDISSWQGKSSTASKTTGKGLFSNSSRNWSPVIKMHHMHVYRHEILP